MRKLLYISSLLALLCAVSCNNNPKGFFAIDADEDGVFVASEGEVFDVNVTSLSSWIATSDNPWITVSPANGPASAKCRISVDSTVASVSRMGVVRFSNRATGENLDLSIVQAGYGYNMSLQNNHVQIDNYASMDDRYFDVKVLTNVEFRVEIPSTASKWLSYEISDYTLDRGARPREVNVRFKWGVNSVPMERDAVVRIVPKDASLGASSLDMQVLQAAAPVIEPGHDGDSIAVLAISRNLGMWYPISESEPMRNWDVVTLWEETDEGYTPDKAGRVRSARFTLFQTEEELPYEVQYLTAAEELYFFSNVNNYLFNLDMGENICKLENLKKLTISAYGLNGLNENLTKLKNLEYLDISSNNFDVLPDILTPENFPNLKHLMLNTCQRHYIMDLSNNVHRDLAGFHGPFPERLLRWENLESLRLSVNFLEGEMPDMEDYEVRYTEEDLVKYNLPPAMLGKPKVLPNATFFAFNLNRMYGELPEWVLYHPNLTDWEPYTLCYPQEGRASNGTYASFSNVPVNMDYYWNFYDGYKEHVDIYVGD